MCTFPFQIDGCASVRIPTAVLELSSNDYGLYNDAINVTALVTENATGL